MRIHRKQHQYIFLWSVWNDSLHHSGGKLYSGNFIDLNDYSSLAVKKTCFAILLLCMVSTIFQMIYNIEVKDAYSAFVFSGRTHRGGGYLGALICSILYKELGGAGSVLVVLLISVISLILVTRDPYFLSLRKQLISLQ